MLDKFYPDLNDLRFSRLLQHRREDVRCYKSGDKSPKNPIIYTHGPDDVAYVPGDLIKGSHLKARVIIVDGLIEGGAEASDYIIAREVGHTGVLNSGRGGQVFHGFKGTWSTTSPNSRITIFGGRSGNIQTDGLVFEDMGTIPELNVGSSPQVPPWPLPVKSSDGSTWFGQALLSIWGKEEKAPRRLEDRTDLAYHRYSQQKEIHKLRGKLNQAYFKEKKLSIRTLETSMLAFELAITSKTLKQIGEALADDNTPQNYRTNLTRLLANLKVDNALESVVINFLDDAARNQAQPDAAKSVIDFLADFNRKGSTLCEQAYNARMARLRTDAEVRREIL
ncbi:MAG: hypothetical protein ACPGRX_00715 [Bdellovibrionales bacterium]